MQLDSDLPLNDTIGTPGSPKLLTWAMVLVVMSAIALVFSKTINECLWEHTKIGLDFLTAGTVIRIDPYSYMTADRAWLDYNWFFEVLLGWCYKTLGVTGLCLLKLSLVLAFTGLLFAHLLRNRIPIMYASMIMVMIILVLGCLLFGLRPHLMSAICFTLMMMILNAADAGHRKWLLAIPPLMAVWCNLHGGWISGLGMTGIWCAADILQCVIQSKSLKSLISKQVLTNIAVIGCCAIAVTANPYGIELPLFLGKALSVSRSEIPDWHPISISEPLGKLYVAWILATIFILRYSRRPKSLPFLVTLIAIAVQPMSAMRHILLTIIGIVVLCAKHLSDVCEHYFPESGTMNKMPRQMQLVFSGCCVVAAICMFIQAAPRLTNIEIISDVPVRAVSILEKSGVSGNLATLFDWGDYCIWHLSPKIKVSTDGRREVAYSDQAMALNMKFTYGLQDWDELLSKYPTDIVMASKNYAVFDLMTLKPDWQLCYQDEQCGLFARKGSPTAEKLSVSQVSKLNGPFYFP